jgi:hypothetical protein
MRVSVESVDTRKRCEPSLVASSSITCLSIDDPDDSSQPMPLSWYKRFCSGNEKSDARRSRRWCSAAHDVTVFPMWQNGLVFISVTYENRWHCRARVRPHWASKCRSAPRRNDTDRRKTRRWRAAPHWEVREVVLRLTKEVCAPAAFAIQSAYRRSQLNSPILLADQFIS